MEFKIGLIDTISGKMSMLPVKEEKTLKTRGLIQKLAPDIREARRKGYSFQEISNILAESGVKITASTIKVYIAKDTGEKIGKTLKKNALVIRRKGGS
jgi:hypothetical protein